MHTALSPDNHSGNFRIPGFFIVGAPKCGTTAMCSYLNQHPDIYIPPIKEINFFGADLTGNKHARTIGEYLSFFEANQPLLCGEGSVWYLYSKTAASEIHAFNREAKILIMLRDPVDLMYSLHSQALYVGFENIVDFKKALDAENDRRQGRKIPRSCKRIEALFYREVVNFTEQVNRYFELFGTDRVKVILYDDLKMDAAVVYKEILGFLGKDNDFLPEFAVVNSNKRNRIPALRRFMEAPPSLIQSMGKALIPQPFRHLLKQRIRGLNTKYEPRKPLDPATRKWLQSECAPEIKRLSDLLGRDITHWSR